MLCLLSILFSFSMNAQKSIQGTWNTGQDNTLIEIEEVNGVCNGTLVSTDKPGAKIGAIVVKEVKPSGSKWKGKVYSPKKKDWFDADLEAKGDKLTVTIKSGFMSKTVDWTRK